MCAIDAWERSSRLDPSFSIVWRNLGIGYFNILGDACLANEAFDKAIRANPQDARVLYERDQLAKRTGESPERRLVELEKYPDAVRSRDDLSVELASLYNQTRQHYKALCLIRGRRFQPWEGGEGRALGEHVRTHLALGRAALANRNPSDACLHFEAALQCPENLGEATHVLANESDIYYLLGVAFDAKGDQTSANQWWERAATHRGDFQQMSVASFSEMTYYNALALERLSRNREAKELLSSLRAHAQILLQQEAQVDYFATSLPEMLLFSDDLQKRNTVTAKFLQAQACSGLGERAEAKQLIDEVLRLDRNHAPAADLLAEFEMDSERALHLRPVMGTVAHESRSEKGG